MNFKLTLPPLPYSLNALEPVISKETLEFHHGKHHKAYVEKGNELLEKTPAPPSVDTLEKLVKESSGTLFNQAAQVWNHNFYWNCLTPIAKSQSFELKGELLDCIRRDFGSPDEFKKKFNEVSLAQFGSGWAWLVQKPDGKLSIESTSNAENPLKTPNKPLFTCDVWEHAYYIDYRNARAQYLDAYWKLANWEFVQSNLKLVPQPGKLE